MNRRSLLAGAAALVVTVVLAIIIFGGEFHAFSSDAGQHYALVKALMDTHSFAFPDAPHLSSGLTTYPSFSHYLAAKLGGVTGSGLLGMTTVVSVSVAVFYLAMFGMADRIDWRAPAIAAALTISYALYRGPVFGRMVVNNYFYAQLVGSAIAVATMFVVYFATKRWKWLYLDIFVAASIQLVVATHLMPAAQLAASYTILLLVLALIERNKRAIARPVVFALATLLLTYFNPFSRIVYDIAQNEAGAHINLFGNRLAQLCLLGLGTWASVKLLRRTYQERSAGLVLGSLGLGTCGFAALQIVLFWFGFGSHYAIAKNMFLVVAVFLFVCAAVAALDDRFHEIGTDGTGNLVADSSFAIG